MQLSVTRSLAAASGRVGRNEETYNGRPKGRVVTGKRDKFCPSHGDGAGARAGCKVQGQFVGARAGSGSWNGDS